MKDPPKNQYCEFKVEHYSPKVLGWLKLNECIIKKKKLLKLTLCQLLRRIRVKHGIAS